MSTDNVKFTISEANVVENGFILSGHISYGYLELDGQVTPKDTMEPAWLDVFTVKLNQDWECEWLTSYRGGRDDHLSSISIDPDLSTFLIGTTDSEVIYCGEDSLETVAGWNWESIWFSKLNTEGESDWIRQVDAKGGGVGSGVFQDGSIVISGNYYSNEADFGDTILMNLNSLFILYCNT